jgi:hypothetical protein
MLTIEPIYELYLTHMIVFLLLNELIIKFVVSISKYIHSSIFYISIINNFSDYPQSSATGRYDIDIPIRIETRTLQTET